MKFARYLEDTQTPEWKRAYIDYRLLKKRITAIRKVQTGELDSSSDEGESDNELELPKSPRAPLSPGASNVRLRNVSPDGRPSGEARTSARTQTRRTSTMLALGRSRGHARISRRFSMNPAKGQQPPTLQEILPRLTSVELAFFTTLDAQLEKVEKFYQAREVELQTRAKALKIQLEELGDHKKFLQAAHNSPQAWSSALISNFKGRLLTVARPRSDTLNLELLPRRHRPDSKETDRGQGGDNPEEGIPEEPVAQGRRSFSADPEDYLHAKKKLKKAVLEHYRGLELLHNYRVLNITGFRKALKKFEKTTMIPVQQPYMTERIEKSGFSSDKNVRAMMEEMEALYTLRFTRNDRKRAVHRLKAGSAVKSHHYSSFRSGIFFGLALPPLIAGLWSSYQESTRDEIPGWQALIYIYGILVVPVLFSILVGINLLVWARARINYGFIFELDNRTRLDYREYFELPSVLFVTLCYAFWLSFDRIGSHIISPTLWPVVWIGIWFVIMVNPLPILFRSSRYWLIRKTGKLFISGWCPVVFADFWLGDQFCSLTFTLSNLYFLACVYGVGFDGHWRTCSVTGRFWPIAYFLASLPLVIRLVQSVKRYIDSGLITHLVNGGKYGTGIITNVFFYLWRHQGGTGRGTVFVMWCMTNTLSSIYSCGWDFWMDWSFLRPHVKHPLLRKELLYTDSIPYYYVALFTNVIIRFIWVIYVPKKGPDMMVRSFIAAILEMYRRWQWNFYRLENEHLGNIDQYRVTREVPLPYSFNVEEDDDAEDQDMIDLQRTVSIRRQARTLDERSSTLVDNDDDDDEMNVNVNKTQ